MRPVWAACITATNHVRLHDAYMRTEKNFIEFGGNSCRSLYTYYFSYAGWGFPILAAAAFIEGAQSQAHWSKFQSGDHTH
jgi:hypothetical protein